MFTLHFCGSSWFVCGKDFSFKKIRLAKRCIVSVWDCAVVRFPKIAQLIWSFSYESEYGTFTISMLDGTSHTFSEYFLDSKQERYILVEKFLLLCQELSAQQS